MKTKYTSDSKMDPKLKAKWVAALRSGEYKQTKEVLERLDVHGKYEGNCCLGVLCRITDTKAAKPRYQDPTSIIFSKDSVETLSPYLRYKFGLGDGDHDHLTRLNDGSVSRDIKARSFKQIATFIEKNIGVKEDAKRTKR